MPATGRRRRVPENEASQPRSQRGRLESRSRGASPSYKLHHNLDGQIESATTDFVNGLLTLDEDLAARAYQGKGIALLLTGDRDGGFASVQRALAENDMLSRSWSALGYYHDANSNWAEAVDAYDRALALDPDSAETYNNRGFSMMMQQRYGEAVEDLNHALRLDPELSLARENLRLTLAWQGDYAHALSGVAENDLPKTLNNIGFVALLRGDYATAEAMLARAMEADPTFNQVAWKNLTYLRSVRVIDAAEATKAN